MPSQVHIITSITQFYQDVNVLLRQADLFFYIEKITGSEKGEVITVDAQVSDISPFIDGAYHSFFITAVAFEHATHKSFYADNFYPYVIEGRGGRVTATDIESISLRVVAKAPDKRLPSFINRLIKYWKSSEEYGVGVNPGIKAASYQRTWYKKSEVLHKIAWFDFKHKGVAIVIPPAL
jgi:hypothetical protein